MRRSKFSLSHYRLLTCSMGGLYPIACYEVLPGDSVQQQTSILLRVSPLLAPVMHPVVVRVHHWYVPNRIMWDGWEDFITGGKDGMGDGAVPPFFAAGTWQKGHLADYFGLPVGVAVPAVSKFPFMAYDMIYNTRYRDEDLAPERDLSDPTVAKIAWEKDYFTTTRPWPQKGPDVSLPLGVAAPVKGLGFEVSGGGAGNQFTATNIYETQGVRNYATGAWANVTAGQRVGIEHGADGLPDVFADLTNATATNINDVRKAFAIQRYQEARAQYGHRFEEYLAYLGVKSSDARLQRPEYLGGGKATISFSEVLRTGNETTGAAPAVIGEMKGHGISALRSRRYRRFFEEHGIVMSLLSVRPRTMYMQGVHRMWRRGQKEDYWQRELEFIGQQDVKLSELFAFPGSESSVFGYQDRYDEYRRHESGVSGDFRDTLNFWHMARDFSAAPVLNQSFIECDPTKRINAEQTTDNLWVMASHSIQARRLLTKKTIGRII